MASLSLKNITKIYPKNVTAVQNFSLEIQDKEFLVFVGPSGCGKSTTLRMIAGLEEITNGELYIDNKLVNEVASKDRDISMVFQNYALYPHMTVYDNIAFGLKLRKIAKTEIHRRILEVAKLLNIEEYLQRKPKTLSGGQRQRVALGRAIVREPKVFLMDEPLSNLDAKLRVKMRTELSKLHKKLQTTFIYVTHDQTEAMTMGDRIVVMKDGVIQQVDTPLNIYNYPQNIFVAGFIGSPQMNFLEGKIQIKDNDAYFVFGENSIILTNEKTKILKDKGYNNANVILGIRPEDIHIERELIQFSQPALKATIDFTELMGSEIYLYLKVEGQSLTARIGANATVKPNTSINIAFNTDKIHIFNKEDQKSVF